MQGKFESIDFTTLHKDVGTPTVKDGRIDRDWFEKNISAYAKERGYNYAIFHFSEADGKKWGLDSGLRGSTFNDNDFFGESWVRADEKSTVTFKDGSSRDKYTKVVAHEIAHELKRQDITKLEVHDYDYQNEKNDIEGFYKDLGVYKTLLDRIKELTARLWKPDLQPLVKRKADEVVKEMELLGFPIRITQGFRSIEEQDKLYAQGRTTPGQIVTNAKGGESFHNYGVAVDVVFRKEGYNAPETLWQTFGTVGKKHGFEWGGDWKTFKDRPHLQMTLGYSLKDFQEGRVDYSKFK